jgi:hypothetical protein
VIKKLLTNIVKDTHSAIIENLLVKPDTIIDSSGTDISGPYLQNLQNFYKSVTQHCHKLFESKPQLPINENVIRPLFSGIFLERRNTYIELELAHLKELYMIYIRELLLEETRNPEEVETPQNSFGNYFGNYLVTPRKPQDVTPSPIKKRKSLNMISSNPDPSSWEMIERDPLKLDFVVNLIHLNDEAIKRAIDLSFQGEL